MNYYVLDNENIIPLGNTLAIAQATLEHFPQYKKLELKKTSKEIVFFEGKYYFEDDAEYIKKKEKSEKEHIANLKCTKRVFVLLLEELGLDYFEQIEPLINANRQAKLEWELCVELERKNPLLDSIGAELKITPEQLDRLFLYANGEVKTLV